MSGSGRKTGYRKAITRQFLYEDREPKGDELIVQVTALRGSNLFEVDSPDGTSSLALLPHKFRKLIWIRRGDYLIVSSATDDVTTSEGKKGAVTFLVEHILNKDQIKSLRNKNLWPERYQAEEKKDSAPMNSSANDSTISSSVTSMTNLSISANQDSDYETPDDESDLYVNNNRMGGQFDDESDVDSD